MDEIYEYYYIQKKLVESDTLMGISQEELTKISMGNPYGEEVFRYLSENIELIHSRIESILSNTVSSRLVYSYESVLPLKSRLTVSTDLSNHELYKLFSSDYL
jgi:hypothetical protein